MAKKITIKPAGIEFEQSENETLLQAAINHNYPLLHSCKNGQCGVCKATIIEGRVRVKDGNIIDSGEILTCSSMAVGDVILKAIYVPELVDIREQSLPSKISSILWPTPDVCILKLRLPPTAKFKYLPGQYVDLKYKGTRRSYSIANANGEDKSLEFHIRMVPGGKFSAALKNEMAIDTLLQLSGPKGTFFARDTGRPIILVAGGTGFAPVKAIVESFFKKESKRLLYIYWGMPGGQDFYLVDPQEWSKRYENIRFIPVVSGNDLTWAGRTGFVHQAVLEDFANLDGYDVYACGSPAMIQAIKTDFPENGLVPDQFYSDAFTQST